MNDNYLCELNNEKDQTKTDLKLFHKNSNRHVLTVEVKMPEEIKNNVFHTSESLRRAGNKLRGIMQKKLVQLLKTKKYKSLQKAYKKVCEDKKTDEQILRKRKKEITDEMQMMQKQYGVTWDMCRKTMISISKEFQLHSVFALTKAEDVWRGVEQCLYRGALKLHFDKKGEYSSLRSKQWNRTLPLKSENKTLLIGFEKNAYPLILKDKFQKDEVEAILSYLSHPSEIDSQAAELYRTKKVLTDTYRPCYVTLVPQIIRGKKRIFAHICIEGKPMPKYNRQGQLRHSYGTGHVGCDIGTQTIAYTADDEVGLKNLSERGMSIQKRERKQRLLLRAMDRSRRATNPEYYDENGCIKKGKKTWKYSKRYKKLKAEYQNLCRIAAVNRKLAIHEDVNHLRVLGDVFITESKNASRLSRRTKKTEKNEKGRFKRKKRFGKSIQNRCPGYFQACAKTKFESTGGRYIEVPQDYRASQYDHTCDEYIKKKLSDRMYALNNGTVVQRDWYSSFLLYNCTDETNTIDKKKCKDSFQMHYQRETELIQDIRSRHLKIMNSGIR